VEFTANVFGGSRKRVIEEVAIRKEDLGTGTWLKITPQKSLEAGEYAIAYMPKDKLLSPDTFYDFTIEGEPKK